MSIKKLKAGALQLTIFIVVMIALLLAAFLVLVHTQKQFNLQTDFVLETVNNADRGIEYALVNNVELHDSTLVNLEDEDYKALHIQRDFWGLFEKVKSTSKIKNYQFQKVALIGAKQANDNRTALYLEDNNKPLVVVGNTNIKGVAYAPKRGVKAGNIAGQSYYGSELINGQTKESQYLPKLFIETQQHLKTISKNSTLTNQKRFLDLNTERSFVNSFLEPYQILYSTTNINLENIELTGHIVVFSKTSISVEASSSLKDVILIAPKIEVKNNVVGTFQAFATETISVGSNCKLEYPSALVVYEDKKGVIIPQRVDSQQLLSRNIKINNATTIEGVVLFFGLKTSNNYDPQIIIEDKVIIKGEVYCNTNIELKGTVYGTVYASNFIAKQSGSVYQNHLYNATIVIDSLSKKYVGLPFSNSKKSVLKWLY